MVENGQKRGFSSLKEFRYLFYICGVIALLGISWGVLKSQVTTNAEKITGAKEVCDVRNTVTTKNNEKVIRIEMRLTSIDEKLGLILKKIKG